MASRDAGDIPLSHAANPRHQLNAKDRLERILGSRGEHPSLAAAKVDEGRVLKVGQNVEAPLQDAGLRSDIADIGRVKVMRARPRAESPNLIRCLNPVQVVHWVLRPWPKCRCDPSQQHGPRLPLSANRLWYHVDMVSGPPQMTSH